MARGPSTSARRRWLLRCALVLPLLSALWLVAVLGSLPAAPQIEQEPSFDGVAPRLFETESAFWIHMAGGLRERLAAGLTGGDDGFDAVSLDVWERVAAGDPLSDAVAPLQTWEREHSARVWAWTVEPLDTPPLVEVGIGRPTSIAAATAEALAAGSEVVTGYVPFEPPDGLEETWVAVLTQDGMDLALDPGVFQYWWGKGWDDVTAFTVVAGDTAFAGLRSPGYTGTMTADRWFCPTGLQGVDPRSHDYIGVLDAVAVREQADIWIVGPLTSAASPLRMPEGADERAARELADVVWPAVFVGCSGDSEPVPIELTPEQASLAGGSAAAMEVVTYLESETWVTKSIASGEAPPSALAFLVVYDEMPGRLRGPLPDAWRGFVGTHPLAALVAGVLALVLSVPIAIVALVKLRRPAGR